MTKSKFRKTLLTVILTFALLHIWNSPAKALGDSIDNCKIERNAPFENSPVSIGFPIHPDRYVGKTEINVLVASFELSDVKFTKKLDAYKQRDINTSDLISRLSRGKVKVNFEYTNQIYTHNRNLQQWQDLKAGQHEAYAAQNESKSTWGFVREAVQAIDKEQDFSKVDTLVLQGPFDSKLASEEKTAVYEAFMTISEAKGFFRPFVTNEKNVLNAFVMSGTFDWLSYAHELLHNFGLTDLYDMTGTLSGPLAYKWSLFSSGNPTLFYWERWQLGWLNSSEVICFDMRNNYILNPTEITLNYKDQFSPKLIVIRTGTKSAYAIELREPILLEHYRDSDRNKDISGQALVTYSLQSDRIPAPIRTEDQPDQIAMDDLSAGGTRNLGLFEVNVFDSELGQTKLGLWSKSLSTSSAAIDLKNIESQKRLNRLAQIEAKVLAEAKAKQEAEAKAKQEAEAKAKQEAEAKALADKSKLTYNKIKQTITCIKGKSIKKITAYKPKCPLGFKKKL